MDALNTLLANDEVQAFLVQLFPHQQRLFAKAVRAACGATASTSTPHIAARSVFTPAHRQPEFATYVGSDRHIAATIKALLLISELSVEVANVLIESSGEVGEATSIEAAWRIGLERRNVSDVDSALIATTVHVGLCALMESPIIQSIIARAASTLSQD